MYNDKVDYRSLFPMFSVAYIKQTRTEGNHRSKLKSHTLKQCIAVGKCNDSDSLLFYHLPSKQTLSCANGYTFDTFSPANQHFNEKFDANFTFIILQSDHDTIHRPPAHDKNKQVYYRNEGGQYIKCKVIEQPYDEHAEPYTLQELVTGDILQKEAPDILLHDPTSTIQPSTNDTITNIPWIKDQSKVTMILSMFPRPKQAYLKYNDQYQEWSFIPGRKASNQPIALPGFQFIAESMINAKKLFQGWCSAHQVLTARRVQSTSNILASLIINRKVSAKKLENKSAPTLLKHYLLSNKDKTIWDTSYKAEYDGLVDIDTWDTITEQEYQQLKELGKGGLLPTMAISTIKYDGDRNPLRAKYRIVALGNLDPHMWSKEDCFAPVMSHLELRLLTALAVQKKCVYLKLQTLYRHSVKVRYQTMKHIYAHHLLHGAQLLLKVLISSLRRHYMVLSALHGTSTSLHLQYYYSTWVSENIPRHIVYSLATFYLTNHQYILASTSMTFYTSANHEQSNNILKSLLAKT